MSHIVVVSAAQGDLSARMTDRRTWLATLSLSLTVFRYTPDAEGVVFRLNLKFDSEAKAFAQAFGGRVIGEPEAAITLRTIL
jgi:hypothetical protein